MRQTGPNHFSPMTLADLDEVIAVEVRAYPFPWTRQNFADSLDAGHQGVCLRAVDGSLLGYFLLMPVVDESHLLNVCVVPEMQGNGLGWRCSKRSCAPRESKAWVACCWKCGRPTCARCAFTSVLASNRSAGAKDTIRPAGVAKTPS